MRVIWLRHRKKITHIAINGAMYVVLAVMMFPIVWMVFTSLKSNNDILTGKIAFSRLSNAINTMTPIDHTIVFSSVDGYIGQMAKEPSQSAHVKTLSNRSSLQGMSTFYDGHHYYIGHAKGIDQLDISSGKLKPLLSFPPVPWAVKRGVRKTVLWSLNDKIYVGRVIVSSTTNDRSSYAKKDEFEGLSIYSHAGKHLRSLGIDDYLLGTNIYDFSFDGHYLWIATSGGMSVLDTTSDTMDAIYTIEEGLLENRVVAVIAKPNQVWIAQPQGILVLDRQTDIMLPLQNTRNLPEIQSMTEHNGQLIIGTVNGFYTLDTTHHQMRSFFKNEPRFWNVHAAQQSGRHLWIGRGDGTLAAISPEGDIITQTRIRDGRMDIRWENYLDMWKNISFGLYLKNSVIICGLTVAIALMLATMAGYALARFKFPGSTFFSSSILATQMIPVLMFLIPIYILFIRVRETTGVQLVGTYTGIVFVYSTFFVPMSIWILRSFFVSIPVGIEEAARIDGCSRFGVFFRIVLPLAAPGIIATGIYIFLIAWDELMFATILLPQQDMLTIPLGIKLYIGNHQNRFDLMMAASVVATLPILVLFFFVQRWFIKGLSSGAVKG